MNGSGARPPTFPGFCLWVWLLFAAVATAAPAYQIDVWRADDGLPQSTVTSIAQTADGYLWLGTQNGLVRFDGVSFKVYDENNTPAIKNNRIVQLLADRQGVLWIGAEQGNLTRLQAGRFTAYQMPGSGTTFNYARTMCDDAAGGLWVVSCEWHLMQLAQAGFVVPSQNWSLNGMRPDAVANDPAGQICAGTEKELAVWRDGQFKILWNQTNEPNFSVEFLATGRSGGWWVAGNDRLRRFQDGRWVADLGHYGWTNAPVYGLYEDRRSRLWVATLGSGLYCYETNGAVVHLDTRDGLPTDFVRCVTEDREGNIWAGMEGGGLCRLKPATFKAFGIREGLSSDQVMSVCEAADGSYWIGLNGNGLDHLIHDWVEHYGPDQGLMNGHVWSVFQDRAGVIRVGTWGGLYALDQTGHFTNVSDGKQVGGVVLAMYQDRAGALWLGQQAIAGVTRLSDGMASILKIPGALVSLDVRVMREDRDGYLWIGTEDEGLYRWKDGQCTHLGRMNGLANESIWSLCADDDGTVWIGTCGGGLSRWRNGKVTTWTTKDGLVNDVICQILEDDRGNLWLGSYGGVFCVSKAELDRTSDGASNHVIHCVSYRKADGLPSIECQGGFQPAGFKSRDGRLWFPTNKGLAVVNPGLIAQNSLPPPVLIEELSMDGTRLTAEALAADGAAGSPLPVPPGNQHLEFHYTATSLTAPDKVQFKYRLEGLEQEWVSAGSSRVVTYSRVPPGDYQFHVIACNNDGVWNEQGAVLAISVAPFFWQTGWFMVAAVVALTAVIFVIVRRLAMRRLRLRLARLEREQMVERERARIAKDIHDDLGASLTEITILSELAQNAGTTPPEAHADIRKIAAKSKALTQLLDEIVWAVNPRRDTLENFVTYTCTYVEDFLRVAKIQCRLELPPTVPEVTLRTDVRHGLFLVVKEALNNAVKHAAATEVRVRMEIISAECIISIQDNGRGFDPGQPAAPSAGEGLANMRQRVEALGGRFDIFSQPGAGTKIRFKVPLLKHPL